MTQEGAREDQEESFQKQPCTIAGPERPGLETKIKQTELKTKLALAQVSG